MSIQPVGDWTNRGEEYMSKDAAQARFEEAWFEEHDIMGKLEDVQYDELLLQYFNDLLSFSYCTNKWDHDFCIG